MIAILVVSLAGGGNSGANLSVHTGHPSATGGARASGTQSTASQGPLIPATFNGTWSGQVSQPPSDTYHVTVTLATGRSSGTISYSGAGATCSGVLTPTSVSLTRMVMKLGTGQKGCANSTVAISVIGPNALAFNEGNPAASGTLTRG